MKAKYRRRYVGKKVDPFYVSVEWRRMRQYVLQRDNSICQICKRRFGNIVHHRKPRSEYPELQLEEGNLITICELCHAQEHPEKGLRKGAKGKSAIEGGLRVVKV